MSSSSNGVDLGTRELFGGAITMAIPIHYGDASDLRQIPDNQEVYLSPSSDTSVVIEVLGMVEEGLASTDLWEAVKFHFESLAHDNASLSSKIITSPPSPNSTPSGPTPFSPLITTPTPILLTGLQEIHKYSHDPSGAPRAGHEGDTADQVWIGVALWRVWLEGLDGRKKKADVVCSVNVNLSAPDGSGEEERIRVEEWWTRSVQSLKVVDWALFGDTD